MSEASAPARRGNGKKAPLFSRSDWETITVLGILFAIVSFLCGAAGALLVLKGWG